MNAFDEAVINKEKRGEELEDLLLKMVNELQWCINIGLFTDQALKRDPIKKAQKRAVYVLLRKQLKQVIRSFDVEY